MAGLQAAGSTHEANAVNASTRSQIASKAAQALPGWLERIPPGRLAEFGFKDSKELKQARLLPPIAAVMPSHTPGEVLDRSVVESMLNRAPTEWVVPVAVDGRIACLLVLMQQRKGEWTVTSFGSAMRATRLQEGVQALGGLGSAPLERLHLVVFYEPTREFLLAPKPADHAWDWYGIDAASAKALSAMSDQEVAASLTQIRNAIPAPVNLQKSAGERKSRN